MQRSIGFWRWRLERRACSSVRRPAALQAGWSDSTFAAEWVRQQQEELEEEAWADDGLTVVVHV